MIFPPNTHPPKTIQKQLEALNAKITANVEKSGRALQGVLIDEKTLKEIASIADGKYFRATNKKSLESIYQEIDKLEKSKIEVTEYKKKSEKFVPFALLSVILLLIEFLLRNIIFKGIV